MKEQLMKMLERSKSERKGITLYLGGQQLSLVVGEILGEEAVRGRNQEYDHLLVNLGEVTAAAMN